MIEAEQQVLGRILLKPDSLVEVMDILQPEDFYSTAHRTIYEAILTVFKLGEVIDVLSVSETLADENLLDVAGGRSYVNDLRLSGGAWNADSMAYHAGLMKDASTIRAIQAMAFELEDMIDTRAKSEELIAFAQKTMFDITRVVQTAREVSNEELKQKALENLERKASGQITGYSTGLETLDALTEGVSPTNLIVIAGRPGMGKSALAANIAAHISKELPVLFFSFEMSAEEIMERLLVAEAMSVNPARVQTVDIPEHFKIIDCPGWDFFKIRATVMRYRMLYPTIGLVVVDFLQMMRGEGDNMAQKVGGNARSLKDLAKEFKLPVICLSQLSRAVEQRQDKRPMESDLKESGGIEEAADEVILMYRDERYNPNTEKRGIAELDLSKNRDGVTGFVEVLFRGEFYRFSDPVKEYRYVQ